MGRVLADIEDERAAALVEVMKAQRCLRVADAELRRAVRVATMELGATWEQVGSMLGVSKQAAWERFH